MKPCNISTRSFGGMIFKVGLATSLLLMSQLSLAQDHVITRVSGSLYESNPETQVIKLKKFDNLSFTSSSYLGGRLSIHSTDSPMTTISYKREFKADSKNQAEEFDRYIDFSAEELENEVAISVETKSMPPWSGTNNSGRVSVEIQIAKNDNLKIDIRTTVFDIEATGPFASIDISNSSGDISVTNINSKVRVASENGAVSVNKCTGPTTITTSSRPIILSDVNGKLGTIELRNSGGKIVLNSVRGEITARTENASITGDDVRFESGNSIFATENSDISLDASAVSGDVNIRDENGKVNFSLPANTPAQYSLRVEEGGRIYTKSLPMIVEQASRTRVVGYSGSRHSKIEIDMAGVGTINLDGKLGSQAADR